MKAENEKLRAENNRYKEALGNATCPNCGGPAALGEMSFDEQHLRIENARLREEIDRISGIAAKYVGKPLSSFPHLTPRSLDLGFTNLGTQSGFVGEMYGGGDLIRSISGPSEADKPMIVELAVAAMEEFLRMAQAGDPLWTDQVLNEDEYLRTFPRGIGPLGLRSEASRESTVVIMNHVNLVEILMDVASLLILFSLSLFLLCPNIRSSSYIYIYDLLNVLSDSMVKCVLRHCFKSYDHRGPINWSSRKLQRSLASGNN